MMVFKGCVVLDLETPELECSLAAEMRLEVQLWQLGRSSREVMGGKLHELLLAACSEADGPPMDALQAIPMHGCVCVCGGGGGGMGGRLASSHTDLLDFVQKIGRKTRDQHLHSPVDWE